MEHPLREKWGEPYKKRKHTVTIIFSISLLFFVIPSMTGCTKLQKNIGDLKSENEIICSNAAAELGKSGDKQAVEPLIQALNDVYDHNTHTSQFSCAAIDALGELGDERAVDVLEKVMQKVISGEERTRAAMALAKIGSVRATEILIADFIKNNGCGDAYDALMAEGKGNATDPLIAIMIDPGRVADIRRQAFGILNVNAVDDDRFIEALGKLLQSGDQNDWFLMQDAVDTLAKSNAPRAMELLNSGLDSEFADKVCAEAISKIDDVATLIEALKCKNDDVRYIIAKSLGAKNDDTSRSRLDEALEQGDVAVIGGAYRYFLGLRKPGSESLLISALTEYGDIDMAQDFMNCGNQRLEGAATKWAVDHSVPIEITNGVSATPWGGN